MKYILGFILVSGLLACSLSEKKGGESSDPVLEKIAGKNYTEMINLPTTPDGELDTAKMARIRFEATLFQFDTLYEGDKISHEFVFHNEGVQPLYVMQTKSSCGCTVSEYSKAPIKPGESGSIRVVFDATGKNGLQNRMISVLTNAYPAESLLTMRGHVKQKDR